MILNRILDSSIWKDVNMLLHVVVRYVSGFMSLTLALPCIVVFMFIFDPSTFVTVVIVNIRLGDARR